MLGLVVKGTQAYREIMTLSDIVPFLCDKLDSDLDPMGTLPSCKVQVAMVICSETYLRCFCCLGLTFISI